MGFDQLLQNLPRRLGVDLQVTDESGKPLEPGKPGELVARGANIMRGYWNNPSETALVSRDGWFRTGDIGHQDPEGYFFILDRLKDMIVTGGENVYSGEVEAVIYAHPAIREAAVFGRSVPKWGELVMTCVVPKPEQLSLWKNFWHIAAKVSRVTKSRAVWSSWTTNYPRAAPARY